MLRADVVQAHILPRAVSDVVGEASAAGCSRVYSSTYGWALHRQTLLLWKVDDGLQASVRRLHVPELPSGHCFVEIMPHSNSTAVTVLLCTGSGQLCVWLDANFPVPPYSQRVCVSANAATSDNAVICALAASPADSGSSLGFLAVVATADAALHLYHGSQNGIFPRQFYTPTAAAGPKPGMFGALGSVVKALYSEAFDPLHNVQRASASAMAALQLQLLSLGGGRWKLLVLTPEALDCWLLGALAGNHSSEQLLWSYNLHHVLSGSLQARELTVLAFAASTTAQQQLPVAPPATPGGGRQAQQQPQQQKQAVYLWSTHISATSLSQVHALSTLALEDGSVVPTYQSSMQLEPSLPLPQPEAGDKLSQWQVLPHSRYSSCLLLAPNGALLEWMPSAGAPHALGCSSGNLAISSSSSSSGSGMAENWQLLNAAYGVLEFLAQDPAAAGQQPEQAAGGALTPEQEAAANDLLQKTVELMAKEFAAGCPYRDLAEGLGQRLGRLGVSGSSEAGAALLVAFSGSLVDTMGKAGSAGVSSGSLRALLSDKQVRHDLLLAALQAGGVLQQLPAQASRRVFEHAEMLAGVAAVLEWQRQQEAAAGDAQSGVSSTQTAAAAAAIEAAGTSAAEGADAAGAAFGDGPGQHWEVFFSRPGVSMPALFRAVASQAAAVKQHLGADDRSGSVLQSLQQVLGLSGLLQAAVAGAAAKAGQLAEHMPEEATRQAAAGPGWMAGERPRAAWGQIAEACQLLHSRLLQPSQRLTLAMHAHLPALQALLAGLKETLRRSANPSPGLREEYAVLPAEHGASLLADAAEQLQAMRESGLLAAATEAAAGAGPSDQAGADNVAAVQRALVWPLEILAQQHRCHVLLYDTCELLLTTGLLDSARLQMHMRQEVADCGGVLPPDCFTFYVMERWRASGQLSSLLQLGRSGFQPQLQQFLAAFPELLWMSQVQAGQLAKAAATCAAATDAEQASVAACRRLLCLSKLAAHASGGKPQQQRLQAQASARLRQLALQQQLQLGGGSAPLSGAQLVLAALEAADARQGTEAAEAAVAAVEALALMPEQQQSEQYRQLWQRSWRAVLRHTPLQDLAAARAASRAAGGEPAQFEEAVRASALFVAIYRAAQALADAGQVQRDLSPADILDDAGNMLISQVQQEQPAAADCMQDVINEAARAAQPLLASA